MSYKKAMKWHKKHPKGIKNLFMGFDCHTDPPKKTIKEIEEFYPKYVVFHEKEGSDYLTLAEYIGTIRQQGRLIEG